MALTIDFSPVLQAADLMRRVDKDLQKEMRKQITQGVSPWLKSAIRRNASTEVERKLASTARIRGGQRPGVVVGASGKFSGGAQSRDIVAPYEFGTLNRWAKRTYTRRSRNGGSHQVKRATRVQLPSRNDGGRFIYPAVKEAAPALVSAWVAVIMDAYEEATSG